MASGVERPQTAEFDGGRSLNAAGNPRPWRPAGTPDLVSYMADFGLRLNDVEPHQAAMFVAARNLSAEIAALELPIQAGAAGSDDTLAEQEDADALTAYQRDLDVSELPADEMDVAPIRAIEDMARIFPTQWMLEECCPDAFYAKLAQRELLMPQWRTPTREPRREDGQSPDHEWVHKRATAEESLPHAYVLLDTSHSMNARDRRGIVARGLALAFLHRACLNGCRLHLRPFATQVGEASSGHGADDLHAIARRLIGLPHTGQTRLQAALEQAVYDIRKDDEGPSADILLISDGMSRLTRSPLAAERLHTFLVGDFLESSESAGPVSTLKSWSRTFRRIWQGGFSAILLPTPEDCAAAADSLQRLGDDPYEADSTCSPTAFDRLLANLKSLAAELKRSLGSNAAASAAADELDRLAQEAAQKLAQSRASQHARVDAQGSAAADQGLARRNGNQRGGTLGLVRINLWECLKRLATRVWQTLAKIGAMVLPSGRSRDG